MAAIIRLTRDSSGVEFSEAISPQIPHIRSPFFPPQRRFPGTSGCPAARRNRPEYNGFRDQWNPENREDRILSDDVGGESVQAAMAIRIPA
jgi:hypothetical protein